MVGAALGIVNARAGRRVVVWGLVAVLLSVALDFIPLFNLLGYDFSFAMGLLAALASVDIGSGVVTAARRTHRRAGVFRLAGEAAAWSSGVLLSPLALSLLNALRVRNCNLANGLGFFLLLPVGTAVYGAGAGVLCQLMFPRRGRALAFALPVLSIVWTLARLYLDPPVFAYDPFGGYFPGPIYDEALRPSTTFFNFRLCNLVWISAGLAVAWAASRPTPEAGPPTLGLDIFRRLRGPAVVAALLVVVSVVLFAEQASFGFHLGRADLTRILDGERRSARVILRYPTAGGPSAAELDLTMEDLDFRYDQLRAFFQAEPERAITVYQFVNADQKKELVGAGGTLYAKPWTREIFVQGEQFPSRRLRHEMAHVFAASFGDPMFGVAFRVHWKGPIPVPRLASGLIEGIAESADFTDPDGGSTTHQEAAAIIADGRGVPLADLMGAGFSTQSGPRAYTLAGSFTRFLLDTRGAEKLKQIYRSAGDFPGVYGTSLSSLEKEWRGFLSRQTLSAEQRARAREQFRRPAIFKKVCAREQAARVTQARALMAYAPRRAIGVLEQACRDDPAEPNLQVDLAQALAASGESAKALAVLGTIARDADLTAPVRARAAGLTATIQFHQGDFDNTRTALRDVLGAATDEAERRQATAKLRALDDEPARRTLGRVLFGDDINGSLDPVVAFSLLSDFERLHPDDALGPYLVGRQLAFRDPRSAMPRLRVACEGSFAGRALQTDFRRECLRMTMWAAFRSGDLGRSADAARTLAVESSEEAEKLRVGDFLERVAWRQAKQ
jgi:hypothetical protein